MSGLDSYSGYSMKGTVIYMKLLSVIVPCYNEEENIRDFYDELFKNDPFFKEKEIEVELLYVDDGSKDKTVEEVKKLHSQDERVHLISFSRNFGKEAAIYAGLQKAKGDMAVLMDADLQDPLHSCRRCTVILNKAMIPWRQGG